jgi:hypothetical protein
VCYELIEKEEDMNTMVTAGCCCSCYDNANFEVAEEMMRQQE